MAFYYLIIAFMLLIEVCFNVEITIPNAKLINDDDDVDGTPTYLVNNDEDSTIVCQIRQNDSLLNVTVKFFQINGDPNENIVKTGQFNETIELEIKTGRLIKDFKYSCCYQILNKSLNEHHNCINVLKVDNVNSVTPSSSNCSHSLSKSITIPTFSTKQPSTESSLSSWYGVEFPILVIILSVMLLMAGACIRLTRSRKNLIGLHQLTNDNNHQHPPQQNSSIFYINKPLNEDLDLPPSYDDVVFKRY